MRQEHKLSRRQLNALTKARIKMKRAPDFKTAMEEFYQGFANVLAIGLIERFFPEWFRQQPS